jgi:hypothetical protein
MLQVLREQNRMRCMDAAASGWLQQRPQLLLSQIQRHGLPAVQGRDIWDDRGPASGTAGTAGSSTATAVRWELPQRQRLLTGRRLRREQVQV